MQNIITKVEDLRDKFKSDFALEENAYQRACDDVINLLQLLQQTPCYTALELLEQEYNRLANVDPTTMSSHENLMRVIRKGHCYLAMRLIRELSANAV